MPGNIPPDANAIHLKLGIHQCKHSFWLPLTVALKTCTDAELLKSVTSRRYVWSLFGA